MFAPFLVAAMLIAFGITSAATGAGPTNNIFATASVIAIARALLLGVISLFMANGVGIGWRVLVAILYVPAVSPLAFEPLVA
jgi:hypothetical protein